MTTVCKFYERVHVVSSEVWKYESYINAQFFYSTSWVDIGLNYSLLVAWILMLVVLGAKRLEVGLAALLLFIYQIAVWYLTCTGGVSSIWVGLCGFGIAHVLRREFDVNILDNKTKNHGAKTAAKLDSYQKTSIFILFILTLCAYVYVCFAQMKSYVHFPSGFIGFGIFEIIDLINTYPYDPFRLKHNLSYNGNERDIIINYFLILFWLIVIQIIGMPFTEWFLCFIIFVIFQAGVWSPANACGVSLIWSGLSGMTFAHLAGEHPLLYKFAPPESAVKQLVNEEMIATCQYYDADTQKTFCVFALHSTDLFWLIANPRDDILTATCEEIGMSIEFKKPIIFSKKNTYFTQPTRFNYENLDIVGMALVSTGSILTGIALFYYFMIDHSMIPTVAHVSAIVVGFFLSI